MHIALVQQGVWHMSKESMPLAAGYLAAAVKAQPDLAGSTVSIHNFPGYRTPLEMAADLLAGPRPDVVGFSVLGWNFRAFGAVAEALHTFHPRTRIVFGGNHVAHQADRVFRLHEAVDVVVNGEGELTFVDLIRAFSADLDLSGVAGISFRSGDRLVTTEAEQRIDDLDVIPSPILTGTIPLLNDLGEFRYDVALMETNRGCPYKCAFCYWGGAVGQKVRSFSRDRLRQELEVLAQAKAETVVLCDANFGMLRQDEEFVDDLIDVRRRYGFPRALETSWAKNKSSTFYSIVRKMRSEGLQTSFTLALQTLDENALQTMNRRNMKINDWKELAAWLSGQGLDAYAELIWGAPGQTPQSFLDGYDELARHVSRIAAYPLLLLPNTDYTARRDLYGFITVRGDRDDFEYVLATRDISLHENLAMQRFLFWARLLAENLVLRNVWPVARAVLGWEQSRTILSIADHVDASTAGGSEVLRSAAAASVADPDSLAPALEFCFTDPAFDRLALSWCTEVVLPSCRPAWRQAMRDVVQFDIDTRPLPDPARRGHDRAVLEDLHGTKHWRTSRTYRTDVPTLVRASRSNALDVDAAPQACECTFILRFPDGFAALARSTNHEETAHYVARVEREG